MTTPSAQTAQRDAPAYGGPEQLYEHEESRELVALVNDAAELVRTRGEAAFMELRTEGSRWREGETYVYVLDLAGTMLVHADPALEGRNEMELQDVDGKPVVRGLLAAATTFPDKPEGWYHYRWPVPGGLLPRWKSSYVRLVHAPSGGRYVVGSGMYNDRLERAFVVDAVAAAVKQIEAHGEAAFPLLRDPAGPFLAKDAYVFVDDMNGVEVVNPAFPSLEGQDLLNVKDTRGVYIVREMQELARTRGSGWIDYMWPRPGDRVSTQKSAFVSRARRGEQSWVVGCGVYLPGAPVEARPARQMTARELILLVREGAAVLEGQGEKAYADFRAEGSRWFRDDTYFFVLTTEGVRAFHAANPASEGRNDIDLKDVVGRPLIRMMIEAAATPAGEGWVHYMYPAPGEIFPTWKSTFVKRVTFPSGTPHVVGCGIDNMQMDEAFIEDVVKRAAALVAERGRNAFPQLRDRTGPYVFMDSYVFVQSADGTELVNPAFPSLEGRNLIDLKDLRGRAVVREEIDAAMKEGSAWLDFYWYRPGENEPARKRTYVRAVHAGRDTYVVGSGVYVE